MMDIGEEKLQYKNYLKHQVLQKKREKMANETLYQIYLSPKYIPRPNVSMSLHAILRQMKLIRQIFFIYLMTNTKGKYTTTL